jgi:hypothetical protein
MSVASGDPGPAPPGPPPSGRARDGLLRWYPRAWRERYGEEFLAMVEDALGGGPPGWRLRLAVAGYGLRERGHQARRAGRRVLPGVGRGITGSSTAAMIATGYLLAILPHELGAPTARPAGAALDVLTALIALAGLALLAGGLAALPALIRFRRAGRRLKVRLGLSWAAGTTVAGGAGLAWIVFWSQKSSLDPFSASPAYFGGLLVTALAVALALDLWAGVAGRIGRRLDLAPRVRAAERFLGRAAVPAILVMTGINVVWYSASQSSEFWLVWGLYCFVRLGMHVGSELRAG